MGGRGIRHGSAPGAAARLARLLGLLQTGLLQQRLAEDVLLLGEDVLERAADRELVLDRVLVVGNADLVAGPQGAAERPLAVDLDAVGAAEVANVPDPVAQRQ